jgi:hypothetical protein
VFFSLAVRAEALPGTARLHFAGAVDGLYPLLSLAAFAGFGPPGGIVRVRLKANGWSLA